MAWRKLIAGWLVVAGMLTAPGAYAQTATHSPPPGPTCSGDRLVWVNTRSGVYHYQGERYFGSTKEGKFICEKDAQREGDRPTRNGQ